jgi:hypothetical protein
MHVNVNDVKYLKMAEAETCSAYTLTELIHNSVLADNFIDSH